MAKNDTLLTRWYHNDVAEDLRAVMTLIKNGDLVELEALLDQDISSWVVVHEGFQKVVRSKKQGCIYEIEVLNLLDFWKDRRIRINNQYDRSSPPFTTEFQLFTRIGASKGIYDNPSIYGVANDHEKQFGIWIRNKHWLAPVELERPSNLDWTSQWISRGDTAGESALLKKLVIGDLIEFDRGTYKHWAIYVGFRHIVHLLNTGPVPGFTLPFSFSSSSAISSNCKGKVNIEDLLTGDVWPAGKTARVNNSRDKKDKPLPWFQIFNTAIDSIMIQEADVYNLSRNNCEHWVTGMRYDISTSEQVQTVIKKIVTGVAILISMLGSPAVSAFARKS